MNTATNERLILGAMSGTSADGVDVALTHLTGRGLSMQAKLLTHAYHAYTPELRKLILETRQRGDVRLSDLAEMGRQVTLAYVEACRLALKQANVSADQVAAIAAHGQTLFHGPPNTIQYFDPSLLAYETGIAVVSDFRRADLAAGGQGAPLVPFADWILFRHPTKNRVLLNIGGIANITYLKAGGSIDEVIAFDTGPGNCIADELCRRHQKSGPGYDVDGTIARSAQPDREALEFLMARPYTQARPPKTTDGPQMLALFDSVPNLKRLSFPIQLATATVWTTAAIQLAIHGLLRPNPVDEILIAGGGAKNTTMFEHLRRGPMGKPTTRTSDLGIPTDAREALAFALLGAATLDGEPSNVPSATGAKRRVVLGSITPKP